MVSFHADRYSVPSRPHGPDDLGRSILGWRATVRLARVLEPEREGVMTILATTRRLNTHLRSVATLFLSGSVLTLSLSVPAEALGSPVACQEYTGEAHIQCLHIYIEMQEKRIAQMEGALHGKAVKGSIGQPLDEVSAVPQGSQPPISFPSADSVYVYPSTAPGYAYAGYGYPGVPYMYPPYGAAFGLSLYPGLGVTLGFGGPGYYSRPFFATRYIYRPGFFRSGFYRPRFYGPRIYGGPRLYSSPRSFSRPYGFRSFGRGHR